MFAAPIDSRYSRAYRVLGFTAVPAYQPILRKLLLVASLLPWSVSLLAEPPVELESEAWVNNFAQQRSEQLISEGSRLLQQGAYQAAVQQFSEAVQIAKINNGLQSRSQMLALALQIEAEIALDNWEAVDSQLAYFEWLNARIYGQNFDHYLDGAATQSRLLLAASADARNPVSARYLIAAKNLNWRTISSIEATLGSDSERLTPWLYNIVLVHFYQSALTRSRGLTSYNYKTDRAEIVAGWSLSRNESLRISHSIGKELLLRIQSILADDAEAAALLNLHLGDWEMLFARNSAALDYYIEAIDKLRSAGVDPNRIDAFFSQPTILPTGALITSLPEPGSVASTPLRFEAWSSNYLAAAVPSPLRQTPSISDAETGARVRFNLTPLSSNNSSRLILALNNMQFVDVNPNNERIRELIREEVGMLQFRPRFVNGTLASLDNVELEYLFSPEWNLTGLRESNNASRGEDNSSAADWENTRR